MEYIEFEGKTYWSIEEEIPEWKMMNDARLRDDFREYLLESDSYIRPDHEHLRLKEYDASEREKYELEEQQRRDKKNRENVAAVRRNGKSLPSATK